MTNPSHPLTLDLIEIAHRVSRPPDHELSAQIEDLTERELEVLHWVATGMSNQEIADTLVVSERTVRTHCSNILSKLNARNRTDAVRIASELNIIDPAIIKAYSGFVKERPYRDGDTEPPDIEGFFWMQLPGMAQPEPVRIAVSPWDEWRIARLGKGWEPYHAPRLRMAGALWWGPFFPPTCDNESVPVPASMTPFMEVQENVTWAELLTGDLGREGHPNNRSWVLPDLETLVAEVRFQAQDGVMPTMAEFDKLKPGAWGSAKAHVNRLGLTWGKLATIAGLKI